MKLYKPDGSGDPSWAPTIEACPDTLAPGGDYRLDGMRLNGLSQACAYGDDAAMATNYPLVRLRAPFPSDTLIYCRTHDHSTMAVATGRSVVSTRFTVPDTVRPGVWNLEVVANGVASVPRPVTIAVRAAAEQAADPAASPRAIFAQGEIFERSLSEVHLLLDFISGRADKSLADLTDVSICDAEGKPTVIASPCIVEEICKISYPPKGGIEAQAAQAAFIMMVTDKLNHLAYPARGLTIAFTAMFSGVATIFDTTTYMSRARDLFRAWFPDRRGHEAGHADATPGARQAPAMSFTAKTAYPQYEVRAAHFRSWYDGLPFSAGFLLFLVIFLNWDVSVTTSGLKQLADDQQSYQTFMAGSKQFLPNRANCLTVGTSAPVDRQISCSQATEKFAAATNSLKDFDASLRRRPYTPIGLCVYLFAPAANASSGAALETFARSLADSASTIIIPALFGWPRNAGRTGSLNHHENPRQRARAEGLCRGAPHRSSWASPRASRWDCSSRPPTRAAGSSCRPACRSWPASARKPSSAFWTGC